MSPVASGPPGASGGGDPYSYETRVATGVVTKEDLVTERALILEQYRHHIKLLLEADVFLFAVTGVLCNFIITHQEISDVRYAWFFIGIFDGLFAAFFAWQSSTYAFEEAELGRIAVALKVNSSANVSAMRNLLRISAVGLGISAIVGGAQFCRYAFMHK